MKSNIACRPSIRLRIRSGNPSHAAWAGVLGDVGDDDDLRAAWDAPALAEDVEFNFAEAAGEGDLLLGRDVLVAEEDDAVVVVGTLDGREGCGFERAGEIDAADFGAEDGGCGDDFEGHGRDCWG